MVDFMLNKVVIMPLSHIPHPCKAPIKWHRIEHLLNREAVSRAGRYWGDVAQLYAHLLAPEWAQNGKIEVCIENTLYSTYCWAA